MPRPSPRQQMLPGFEPAAETPQSPATDQPADNPSDLTGRTVYVLDAHGMIYQVYHALPDMSGPQGQPVGAVSGFLRDVIDLLERRRPDYLFAAFDPPDEIFRHELYPDYKLHREPMPDDLRQQIGVIHRFLESLGIEAITCPAFEADDVLATIARETVHRKGTCFLVTNDKDCRQLIRPNVKLYNLRKNREYGASQLWTDWGVRPEQVVDFQALVGDSVDNVPGVPLVGPKLAKELLQKYGTLEEVLAHADEVSGVKRRENLRSGRDQALVSQQLVRLVDNAPFTIDWQGGRVGGVDRRAALALCAEFGFRRLADRMMGLALEPHSQTWTATYQCVETTEQLQQLVETLAEQPEFAIKLLRSQDSPGRTLPIGMAFAYQEAEAWYVPLSLPTSQQPSTDVCLQLKPLLEDPDRKKIGHDLKADIVGLRTMGLELRGIRLDTLVADYLLAPGERSHELPDLSVRYLNHQTIPLKELVGSGRNLRPLASVSLSRLTEFACEAVDVSFRLARTLQRLLEADELDGLYRELELPLLHALAAMEFTGISIDADYLAVLAQQSSGELERLQSEVYALAGQVFNLDSPKQLADVLFGQLGLPVIKKTKSGPSTDGDVLNQLAGQHPLPQLILEYRQHAKLKSTYLDALPRLVSERTGRIHTSFKQDVAATGRLSSQDPNLQNIPIRTAAGRQIRAAFVAPHDDWRLLAADYSQIELRVLAHYCDDEVLRAAFDRDEDVHARVASEVFDTPLEAVSAEQRQRAKAVNFGVIYGQTPFGLAKSLQIDEEEAAAFIRDYFARYPGVEEFVSRTLDQCRENGYVKTIRGRRRAVDGVRSRARRGDSRFRNLPERIAVNTVIQGSAADLIKTAMVNLHRLLQRERHTARMLLQIHDELVFEVPSDQLSELADLVRREMSSAASLRVPLQVDLKAGRNWADCQAWE